MSHLTETHATDAAVLDALLLALATPEPATDAEVLEAVDAGTMRVFDPATFTADDL